MFPIVVVLNGAVGAAVWITWNRLGRWRLALGAVLGLLLLISLWVTDIQAAAWMGYSRWSALVQLATADLIPVAAIVVAVRLICPVNSLSAPIFVTHIALRWLFAASLLLGVAGLVGLSSLWDVATDGLRASSLQLMVNLTVVSLALLCAWIWPGRWKMAVVIFALGIPFLMSFASRLGTYGRDGQWGTLPALITEQRAQTVNQALQRFHARTQRYPDALAQLFPQDLAYIPLPLLIPGQAWCYTGGLQYYRLGYLDREVFSAPAQVRIYAEGGFLPDKTWICPED